MADVGAGNGDKDESDDDKKRRERIQQVLEGIRSKKMKKNRKLPATATSAMLQEKEIQVESKPAAPRTGRHKDHKVHFGWLHFCKGSFKQVKCRQGGGTRTVHYLIEESQTVESLLSLGKKLFFPEGKSQLGLLNEMHVVLSQFDGAEISVFKDRNGEECNYQEFLKSNGLYSSQHYLYIKTIHIADKGRSDITVTIPGDGDSDSNNNSLNAPKQKENTNRNENYTVMKSETDTPHTYETDTSYKDETGISHETETDRPYKNRSGTILVNGQVPPILLIKYTRHCISTYGGHLTSLSAYSMYDCERFSNQKLDDINCIFQDFTVTSITVGDTLYLDKENEDMYTFPQRQETDCDDFILHGPTEIFGTEDDGKSVIIGVVTKGHNRGKCMFTWFNSEHIFSAGTDQCLVRITEPGIYNVTVEYNGTACRCFQGKL